MGTNRDRSRIELAGRSLAAVLVASFGQSIALLVLYAIAVASAVPIFVGYALVLVALDTLLSPTGALASVLGFAWLVASLVTVFIVLRRGHRLISAVVELPGRVVEELDPSFLAPPRRSDVSVAPDSATLTQRIAVADAHLAPGPGDPVGGGADQTPPRAPNQPG